MSVRFILGRSGTGKTSYCIKAIVEALLEPADEQQLILLVPEQATYQAERAIIADKRISGYNRLHVLSFDRLQFLLLGKNTARSALSRIGQQMIIHRLLREKSGQLKVFGSSANWPGLGRQMAQTITELHQYAKTPEDIDRLLGELEKDEHNKLTALKFADIGLIFKEYLSFIEGQFVDPDVQLGRACQAVAEAQFLRGAKLWVDGFSGFTTSELAILAELLKACAETQIALCLEPSKLDAEDIDPASLFNPTQCTYSAVIELIKKCKLQLAEPVVLEKPVRFSGCRQLAHIERNIFAPEPRKMPAAENVRIISAPNARLEVQFVARQILKLVKEKDYRYRDIAVIASDIERYQHYIRAYFEDYGLPFFIDKRRPLSQHPVIGLICSALQVVSGGFSHSEIFNYLKTDLVPIERCEVDLLENYCLAFGVSAGDWAGDKEWHFAGEKDLCFDEQRVNQIRRKVSRPLSELRGRLCPEDNPAKKNGAAEFTQIVFDFLDALEVGERIAGWIKEADERNDTTTVEEHRQFHERLIDVFDELAEAFAGQEMRCADFLAILDLAFSQLALALIPPKLDQVLVGSIERSRHPDLKAVFLIGATQKQFPVPVSSSSILSDEDRIAAEGVNFPLAATVGEKLAERQYLAYIAFTRASQSLFVTYPLADEKGNAVPRSQLIANLESLFENLNEESISAEQIPIDEIHSKSELADLLCSRLGKDAFRDSRLVARDSFEASHNQLSKLLDDIRSDEALSELGAGVLSAISYNNRAQLDKRIVKKLFGQEIRSSATKLSDFAACPYKYFAKHILQLRERKEFKFEPLDVGEFYHRVLDGLLKQLNAKAEDFATIEDERLVKLLRGEIAELIQEDSFISNFAHRSAHNDFIIRCASETIEDCVLAIAEMVRAGSFRPVQSEIAFGEAGEGLGGYTIQISNGRVVSLNGKIDRLDIAETEGEKTAIVFDYKRRDKTFNWVKFYNGLDMQLPIYMLAVRNASGRQCEVQNIAGGFYTPVEVNPTKATLGEPLEKVDKFRHKAKGIFNGEYFQQLDNSNSNKFYNFLVTKDGNQYGRDNTSGALRPNDFENMLRFTEKKIIQLAEEITSGTIDAKPYRLGTESPCGYCEYKSVCRFDWQINHYNPLAALNKPEVLEQMGAVDG